MADKFYRREWLNGTKGTAFLEAAVEPNYESVYAYLKVADCNRTVHLEFDYDKKTYAARIKKINKLITALEVMRQSMVEHKELLK